MTSRWVATTGPSPALAPSDGGALLASDMHLGHAVPNIWYRAVRCARATISAVGVTLPGSTLSRRRQQRAHRLGFHQLERRLGRPRRVGDESRKTPDTYRTPDGWTRFDTHAEVIDVAGGRRPYTLDRPRNDLGPGARRRPRRTRHARRPLDRARAQRHQPHHGWAPNGVHDSGRRARSSHSRAASPRRTSCVSTIPAPSRGRSRVASPVAYGSRRKASVIVGRRLPRVGWLARSIRVSGDPQLRTTG